MKARTAQRAPLALVSAPAQRPDFTFEIRKALSAAAGKRINDEMRAEILRRDFGPVHIRGDNAPALRLPSGWKAPR